MAHSRLESYLPNGGLLETHLAYVSGALMTPRASEIYVGVCLRLVFIENAIAQSTLPPATNASLVCLVFGPYRFSGGKMYVQMQLAKRH